MILFFSVYLFSLFSVIFQNYQMMINKFLPLLAFYTIALAYSQLRRCLQVDYTFSILSLTWPPQFCFDLQQNRKSCVSGWRKQWDGESMIIHGYWPTSLDNSYLNCFRQYGYDPYCSILFPFRRSIFQKADLDLLNKYWPAIGPMKNFWEYEWDKHGTCYLKIIRDYGVTKARDEQVEHSFFMKTVEKLRKLNIKLKEGRIVSVEKLAEMVGIGSSKFYPICNRSSYLKEIRVCYQLNPIPGEQILIDCPKSNDQSICQFPIMIRN